MIGDAGAARAVGTRIRVGACAFLFTCAAMLSVAAPASAHAYLLSTSPATGAVVRRPPVAVVLTFDEAVSISAGALEVYGPAGARVDTGTVRHPAADAIAVGVRRGAPAGTYTVAWRVTSADTHVVHGVLGFSVRSRSDAQGVTSRELAKSAIPAGVSAGLAIVRGVNLLAVLLCGGGAAALMLVLGDAGPRVRRALLGALVVCGGVLALVAVLGLPFEAAEVDGSGLGAGFSLSALAAVRHLRFGEVWLVRAWLALLFALIALSLQVAGSRRRRLREAALVIVAVALLITLSAAGHASVDGALAYAVDAGHVIAAAVWLGGLAFLVAALALSSGAERWPLAVRAVPRFSLLATGSVAILVVAGVVNADIEVQAWRGLWQSTYGELVVAKVALALPLLGLGLFNNRVLVPRLRRGLASVSARRRFLQATVAELALLAAIVGVSAVLIGEAPAKDEVILTASQSASRAVGPYALSVRVAPARVGGNTISMSVTPSSRPARSIGEVDVAAERPDLRPGALEFNVVAVARHRFRVTDAVFTRPGTWQLEMTVRSGLTEWLARVPIRITRDPGA